MHSHLTHFVYKYSVGVVLILVVMEDALALLQEDVKSGTEYCLNPCCNGRCTRTCNENLQAEKKEMS